MHMVRTKEPCPYTPLSGVKDQNEYRGNQEGCPMSLRRRNPVCAGSAVNQAFAVHDWRVLPDLGARL